jgi:8-oxo-dGTP pyrophosphatase MutT (NUDIX family)
LSSAPQKNCIDTRKLDNKLSEQELALAVSLSRSLVANRQAPATLQRSWFRSKKSMWLFTPFGFFSVVQKKGDENLTIRSRTCGDLLRLRRHYLPQMTVPVEKKGTDYPWRAQCQHSELAQAMHKLVQHIDYTNFKDEVALTNGQPRAKRYAKVWQAMYGMEEDLAEPTSEAFEGLPWSATPPVGKHRAFGGVVVDTEGRILLREVANHFDGYVWTFAKGRQDPGESPRQTALREVQEEMGVEARILLRLPGTFKGGTTQTQFFLMVVDGRTVDLGHRCKETSGICWALPAEAERLIAQTTNELGRQRDMAILAEALRYLPSPAPFKRPIARLEDWECRPMPAARTLLPYHRAFEPAEMAQLIRGFIPKAMEQKWFAYFEDGTLRIHRSWTGFEAYRLHLTPMKEEKGHWSVIKTEFNRHPGQMLVDDREALTNLHDLVEELLLRYGEENYY